MRGNLAPHALSRLQRVISDEIFLVCPMGSRQNKADHLSLPLTLLGASGTDKLMVGRPQSCNHSCVE
jgi:hypothetical protein